MSAPALPSADYSGRQTLTVPIQTTGSSHNSSPGDSDRIAQPFDNSPTPRLGSRLSQPYDNHSSASSGPDHHSPSRADFRNPSPETTERTQDQAQEIYEHDASRDQIDEPNYDANLMLQQPQEQRTQHGERRTSFGPQVCQTTAETALNGVNEQTQVTTVHNGTQHSSYDVAQQITRSGSAGPAYRYPTFDQDERRNRGRAGKLRKISSQNPESLAQFVSELSYSIPTHM